jgi:predicted ATP-grasp superfamily ATP-dependent carboligase
LDQVVIRGFIPVDVEVYENERFVEIEMKIGNAVAADAKSRSNAVASRAPIGES